MPGYPGPLGERGLSGPVGPTVRPGGQIVSVCISHICGSGDVANIVFTVNMTQKYMSSSGAWELQKL